MATTLTLPEIPRAPMYLNGRMTLVWQQFFRSLYNRTGGNEELSNTELANLLGVATNQVTVTADYQIAADDNTVFIDASSGDITITLITATDVGGKQYSFKRMDDSDNDVNIVGTLDGSTPTVLYPYESITIKSDDTNWWVI